MTAPVAYVCDEAEARDLTKQIKTSVEKTWRLIKNAHDWQAWAALGYATWEDYVRLEFDRGRQWSYRLLDQGRVILAIEEAAGVSPDGDITEAAARDLKPHLTEVTDAVREAVADVPELERSAVAAKAVKDARARLTTTTRTTEATKLEQDVDTRTGEVLPPAVRYPELAHYADQPEKAARLADALDGYDDGERETRRAALVARIDAERAGRLTAVPEAHLPRAVLT